MLSNVLTEVSSWEDKVLRLLADIDVCKRCVVRIFRGSFGEYKIDDAEKRVRRGAHCSTCLGILEGFTLYSVGKSIIDRMEKMKYDSPTFQIGIALPQCLILRQSAVITYLCENGNPNIVRDLTTVKNVAKLFLTKLVEKLSNKKMDSHSQLFIKVDFKYSCDAEEIAKLTPLLQSTRKAAKSQPHAGRPLLNQTFRFETIQRVMRGLSDGDVKKYTSCPPKPLIDCCDNTIAMYHSSVFIGGRYNKYSKVRCDEDSIVERESQSSMSTLEFIGHEIKSFSQGVDVRFHPHNRQDNEIGVLGEGLPFAIEVTDPKITLISEQQMEEIMIGINSSSHLIVVQGLQKVTKQQVEAMRKLEDESEKVYKGTLWSPSPISDEDIDKLNSMTNIEVIQKTPIQLLHLVNMATRTRMIHKLDFRREGEMYEFELVDTSGLCMKEFVHGDFGRTAPSLSSLLNAPVEIIELDVITSQCNWPSSLETPSTEITTS